MKHIRKAMTFVAGMVTMALICMVSMPALAANSTQTLQNVRVGGISIVVDGQEIHPTDANGKEVSPLIYNGTTYLPVRAVASAFGKAVYWDGPSYTVYLGEMDGTLEKPTVMMKDMTSIATPINSDSNTKQLTDNYGNNYTDAVFNVKVWTPGVGTGFSAGTYEFLLGMKYSKFKCTLYVPAGNQSNIGVTTTISADGRVIYTSPTMDKTSMPVPVELDITGCNDFKITFSQYAFRGMSATIDPAYATVCVGEAGFYQ